ncbi:hypothetical protein DXT68_05635 [Microbacterium foliorum]|uniref:DUF333 domain-containing protein n=2 Tax=Microbacterium foliorum TaxID=104336 RepID=A0A0F0KG13_9MICO|nr:hypothetical protein DXT68_05635 [Microbacterium foliorum]KJL18206.1 hypothetical protein RN50_03314 [Microbacterium foliorum]
MTKKRVMSIAAGAALVAGLAVSAPLAAQAATGWAGAYIESGQCQADRRLYVQEGYSVGPCQNRPGLPGQWFRWTN